MRHTCWIEYWWYPHGCWFVDEHSMQGLVGLIPNLSRFNVHLRVFKHVRCKPYVWTVPEVNWSSEGVRDLIPFEEKWKLINNSTYMFRGVADLIPYEEKIPLVESVPVKLIDVSARYQDCLKAAGYSLYLCRQRVACLEGADNVWFREILWVMVERGVWRQHVLTWNF